MFLQHFPISSKSCLSWYQVSVARRIEHFSDFSVAWRPEIVQQYGSSLFFRQRSDCSPTVWERYFPPFDNAVRLRSLKILVKSVKLPFPCVRGVRSQKNFLPRRRIFHRGAAISIVQHPFTELLSSTLFLEIYHAIRFHVIPSLPKGGSTSLFA